MVEGDQVVMGRVQPVLDGREDGPVATRVEDSAGIGCKIDVAIAD
jgi:hypothetical protein